MADVTALLSKLQQVAAQELGAKAALEAALAAERRESSKLRAELEAERTARRRAESQARSSAAALQRLRALHPGSGDSDAEAAGGDGGADAALGPSPESPGAGAGAGGSPEDSRFHDSFTQLPARASAEPAPFAPPPGLNGGPQQAAPARRRIVPIPLDRPAAAPRAPSPEARAGGGGEDDEELPPFGDLPDDKYTDGESEEDEEGAEGSDEDEEDEDEAADEDEELDIDGSTSGDSESEGAEAEEAGAAAAGVPGRLNRAQRERLEDEAYALQRQEAAAAAGQTNPLAELLASGAALGGGKAAAGRPSDSGAGAESGGDGLRALAAAAGVGTPAPSVTALVEAELALLQAAWETRELPNLQRRAAAFWRQRERFAAEWRNEEAHLVKRMANLIAKIVDAAPPNEAPEALRRRCLVLEPTVTNLGERRFQIATAELAEEPLREPRAPRQPRAPRAADAAAPTEGQPDASDEEEAEDEEDDGDGGFIDDGDEEMEAEQQPGAAGGGGKYAAATEVLVMHGARATPAHKKRPTAAKRATTPVPAADADDAVMLSDADAPMPADDDMGVEADAPLPLPASVARPHHAPRSAVEVRRALGDGNGALWAWEPAEVMPSAGPVLEAGQPALLVRYSGSAQPAVEAVSRVRPAPPAGAARGGTRGALLELLTADGWRRAVVAQRSAPRAAGARVLRPAMLAASEALRASGTAPAGRGAFALMALCAARQANPLADAPQPAPGRVPARVVLVGDRAAYYQLTSDGRTASGPRGTSTFEQHERLQARRAQRWDDELAAWADEPAAGIGAQRDARRALAERRDLHVRDACVKPLLRGGGAGMTNALAALQRRMARSPGSAWDKSLAMLQRSVKQAGGDTPPALRAKFTLPPPGPEKSGEGDQWVLNLRSPRGVAGGAGAASGPGAGPRAAPRARRSITVLPPVTLFGPNDEGGPPPGAPPVMILGSLASSLKSHQWKGVRFMWSNVVTNFDGNEDEQPGCVLAHSMGLGKTLQVLTLLHALHTREPGRRTLLLVPKNVLANWLDEFGKWLPPGTPGLNVSHVSSLGLGKNPQHENRADIVARWHAGSERPEGAVLLLSPALFATLTAHASAAPAELKQPKRGKGNKKKLAEAQRARAAAALAAAAAGEDPAAAGGEPMDADGAAAAGPGPSAGPAPKSAAEMAALRCVADMLLQSADVVVVDEAHELRNSTGVRSQALCAISTQRRLALTGSPLQNNLLEFWTMMEFVRPTDMGTEKAFTREFAEPINAGRAPDATAEQRKKMLRKLSVLHDMTDSYVQRVGPELLTSELPPKQEKVVRIRPSPLQHAMLMCYNRYCEANGIKASFAHDAFEGIITDKPEVVREQALAVEAAMRASGERGAAAAAAEASKRIMAESQLEDDDPAPGAPTGAAAGGADGDAAAQAKQVEKDPSMLLEQLALIRASGVSDDQPLPCGKLWAVVELARWCMAHNERLLIFSLSTMTLDRIEAELKRHLGWAANKHWLRIDGQTKSDVRLKLIKTFNAAKDGQPPHAFLLSTRAGGVGTNMTSATRAICYDAAWNPTHMSQAIARFYRFGQTKPTYAYRLIMEGWTEDRIYRKAAQKEELSLRVVDKKSMDYLQQSDGADLIGGRSADVPPPRMPDPAALAAWAAGRGDAALEALLAADTAAAAAAEAAAPGRELPCCGPWLLSLAEHEDVLKVNAALKLSAKDRMQAADDWLQEEKAANAMYSAAAAAAAEPGGAPGAAAPKLSSRAHRLATRARKRLLDEQLAALPEEERDAVLARVAAGEDVGELLDDLMGSPRPATQRLETQAVESQPEAAQEDPVEDAAAPMEEPEEPVEVVEVEAAPVAPSPPPPRVASQAPSPARAVIASPPAASPRPSQRAPSQRMPLHPAPPVVAGWGDDLTGGAASAVPPEKQASKYIGYTVPNFGGAGLVGRVAGFANGLYKITFGQGRVEHVPQHELRDLSPRPTESDFGDQPAEAPRAASKRPRSSEADAERNARPRPSPPAEDEIIDLS